MLSLRDDIDGVVSVNSPDSPMDAVIAPAYEMVGPVSYANYPMLWLYQAMLFGPDEASLSASNVIEESSVPVLVIHAKSDRTVPLSEYSLYWHIYKTKCESIDYAALEGDHTSVLYGENGDVNRELADKIDSFFESRCENGGD